MAVIRDIVDEGFVVLVTEEFHRRNLIGLIQEQCKRVRVMLNAIRRSMPCHAMHILRRCCTYLQSEANYLRAPLLLNPTATVNYLIRQFSCLDHTLLAIKSSIIL